MKTVTVVGTGVIGRGIVECLAEGGHFVNGVDVSKDQLRSAERQILSGMKSRRLFNKELPSVAEVVQKIQYSTCLSSVAESDFIIECVTEKWSIKEPLYRAIDSIARQSCIFIANPSVYRVDRIASVTARPDRVIGVHFMNPVPLKHYAELIVGSRTSAETTNSVNSFLNSFGKRAIELKDSPGFVSNRVMMPAVNEAAKLVEEGVGTAETVDQVFVNCFSHKMGPLATADLIGLDTVVDSLFALYDELGEERFLPCSILQEKVRSGELGVKAGRGFFTYSA